LEELFVLDVLTGASFLFIVLIMMIQLSPLALTSEEIQQAFTLLERDTLAMRTSASCTDTTLPSTAPTNSTLASLLQVRPLY